MSKFKAMKLAKMENLQTFQDYLNRLSLLALTVFEWEGLPESVDERYLEKQLFYNGTILFFEDFELGEHLALKCFPSGTLNFYDLPVSYTTCATLHSKTYLKEECVLIRDNYLECSPYDTIMQFAYRLSNAERIMDLNINAQKTPFFIKGTNSQMLTLKNLYAKYEGNEPVIIGDKDNLTDNPMQVLKTDAPFVADKLQIYQQRVMNQALTFIGVNNANTDKKERLISSEVDSNNDNVDLSMLTRLTARKQACKLINKMFGLNISVKVREMEEKVVPKEEPKEVNK